MENGGWGMEDRGWKVFSGDIYQDPLESFQSFNEFFYRKFDLSKRPIDPSPVR
jgi:phosphatidylserine decarboxylase